MEKDRLCRKRKTFQKLAVVCHWFGRRGKQVAASHEASISKSRVSTARLPKMTMRRVSFCKDRECEKRTIL
jgi:hypothetical protein